MFKNISKSLLAIMTTMLIIAATFGVTNLTVANAAAEATTIGYVNVEEIQNVYTPYLTALNNVNNEYQRVAKEFETKSKNLNDTDKAKMEEQYNKDLNAYAAKQLEGPQKAFKDAVAAVAKEKGITVVLDGSAVLMGATDITTAVKTKLIK